MNRKDYKDYIVIFLILWIISVSFIGYVFADSERTYIINEAEITNVAFNADRSIAKATAAGQHHYKATAQLQWSVGAGFSGNESALSFGLGLQTGNIFWAGNITDSIFSSESSPVIGVSASGTF